MFSRPYGKPFSVGEPQYGKPFSVGGPNDNFVPLGPDIPVEMVSGTTASPVVARVIVISAVILVLSGVVIASVALGILIPFRNNVGTQETFRVGALNVTDGELTGTWMCTGDGRVDTGCLDPGVLASCPITQECLPPAPTFVNVTITDTLETGIINAHSGSVVVNGALDIESYGGSGAPTLSFGGDTTLYRSVAGHLTTLTDMSMRSLYISERVIRRNTTTTFDQTFTYTNRSPFTLTARNMRTPCSAGLTINTGAGTTGGLMLDLMYIVPFPFNSYQAISITPTINVMYGAVFYLANSENDVITLGLDVSGVGSMPTNRTLSLVVTFC